MNLLCLLGKHKFKRTMKKFYYDTPYSSKQLREVEYTFVCKKCGVSKIRVINYDKRDIS